MKNKFLKIGNKYIVPSGTKLWFINLQQSLITTKKYVIEVTHTLTTDDISFFGDLYEVTFDGIENLGLLKILHGETSSNLNIVKPIGDLLKSNNILEKFKNYLNEKRY